MRLRILATAGRLIRTARRHVLHIDPAWPWAATITTAHARRIPVEHPDPGPPCTVRAGLPSGLPQVSQYTRFPSPTSSIPCSYGSIGG